jgi:hypothetical protein
MVTSSFSKISLNENLCKYSQYIILLTSSQDNIFVLVVYVWKYNRKKH